MVRRFDHANWVLLTTALIMRANYSVTRRRRWDRVAGTLIGCALAVTFINTMPPAVLLLFIVMAVGVSHAYGLVAYRITAIGASISSLLLLHFVAPLVHPQFFERITDTLIGAGLSWAFSYLLPSWESEDLPKTVRGLLEADAGFADAALCLTPVSQSYRLARKKAWMRWRNCRAPSAAWPMSPTSTAGRWRRWASFWGRITCWPPTCLPCRYWSSFGCTNWTPRRPRPPLPRPASGWWRS